MLTAGQSVDHHFLTSYHHTILSIVLAQFSPTGFADGMEGMLKLVAASSYLQACRDPLSFALLEIAAGTYLAWRIGEQDL